MREISTYHVKCNYRPVSFSGTYSLFALMSLILEEIRLICGSKSSRFLKWPLQRRPLFPRCT